MEALTDVLAGKEYYLSVCYQIVNKNKLKLDSDMMNFRRQI